MQNIIRFVCGSIVFFISCLFLESCDPIPTCDQIGYTKAKDAKGKELQTLDFPAEGDTQTIYVETTLPRWMARPTSLNNIPWIHPDPDALGYVTIVNPDGWMQLKYKHPIIGVFNGFIEVTLSENTSGSSREDGVYVWNDDIPATITASTLVVISQAAN